MLHSAVKWKITLRLSPPLESYFKNGDAKALMMMIIMMDDVTSLFFKRRFNQFPLFTAAFIDEMLYFYCNGDGSKNKNDKSSVKNVSSLKSLSICRHSFVTIFSGFFKLLRYLCLSWCKVTFE